MNPAKIFVGLVPFALFAVLGSWIPIGAAALVGLVAAVVVVLADLHGGVKAVPALGVVVLGVIAALAFAGGPAVQEALTDYGRGLATVVLALYILVTSKVAPFTAQIARETVPRQYWHTERFVSVNRRVSRAWGLAVLLMGAGHLLAGALVSGGVDRPFLALALNWGVPVLVVLKTVAFTRRVVGDDAPQVVAHQA